MLPYEEDVRIPMFLRLPVIPGKLPGSPLGVANIVSSATINIDVAPTMLDLAGYSIGAATEMDGASMLPLIGLESFGTVSPLPPAKTSGRSFLIEYFPIPTIGIDVQISVKGTDGWCVDPDVKRSSDQDCPSLPVIVDSVNNTWACIRTVAPPLEDSIFCHFFDATGYTIDFNPTDQEVNFVEYYDMLEAPWQITNQVTSLQPSKLAVLKEKLAQLMTCKGAASCATAGRWQHDKW